MPNPAPDKPPVLALLASKLLALGARGNWTPSALAEQAHVTRRMIQLVEQSGVNASLKTVDKLARALGVTTASLLGVRPVARRETSSVIEEVLAQNLGRPESAWS